MAVCGGVVWRSGPIKLKRSEQVPEIMPPGHYEIQLNVKVRPKPESSAQNRRLSLISRDELPDDA